jgi:hypothetical protein
MSKNNFCRLVERVMIAPGFGVSKPPYKPGVSMRYRNCALIAATIVVLLFCFVGGVAAHPGSGIVVDEQGNVYFADLSRGLLKIDGKGKATKVTAEGGHWLALDQAGAFARVDFEKSSHWPRWFKRRTPAGARPALISDGGAPLVVAGDGNLYYACSDSFVPGGLQIARLTPDGKESLLTPELKATSERLKGIKGLALGPDGWIYASYPQAILRVSVAGKIEEVKNPVAAPECDKHPEDVTDAPSLRGLAVGSDRTVYVAATGCRCLLKIAPDGKTVTFLKTERPWAPCGISLHGKDVYVLEHVNANSEQHESWPPRVRKVGQDGKVSTLVDLNAEK